MQPVPKSALPFIGQVQNLGKLILVLPIFLIQIFRNSLVLVRIRASPAMVLVCDLAKQKFDEEKPKYAGLV
jgi:hypothetical protein